MTGPCAGRGRRAAAGRRWGAWLVAAMVAAAPLSAAAQRDDTLYLALGGRAQIARLMDDFVARLRADAHIGLHFRETNLEHLSTQLTDQVCQLAGGPCVYEGPTMREAHAELALTRGDFLALVARLQDAMDAQALPWAAQRALLARLAPMHRDVITR